MRRVGARDFAVELPAPLEVTVDRERARFSAWYELFPRSASDSLARHGTFADVERRLPYVASMGFDVLYLPPIHPIGRSHRKGPNNAAGVARRRSRQPLGDRRGGGRSHRDPPRARHARRLRPPRRGGEGVRHRDRARPRVPVRARPPLGARAPRVVPPPPRRHDPVRREPAEALRGHLPARLRGRGVGRAVGRPARRRALLDRPRRAHLPRRQPAHEAVRVLGVADRRGQGRAPRRDLPRRGVHAAEGDEPAREGGLHAVVHVLHVAQHRRRAARRTSTELTTTDERDYFRPNFWPNTPDILPEHLQIGGRATFVTRLVLAATLSSNYGIYGPAFELGEHRALRQGGEEYLDSEKYELRHWDLDDPDSLRPLIALVNACAREQPRPAADEPRALPRDGQPCADRLPARSTRPATT